LLSTEDDTLAH